MAADALVRRWTFMAPVVIAALVVGIPGNFAILVSQVHADDPGLRAYREFMLSLPRLEIARDVPPTSHPDPAFDNWVTMGWLRAGAASGRIPSPGPVSRSNADKWSFGLALEQTPHPAKGACAQVSLPATLHLEKGDTVTFSPAITLVNRPPDGVKAAPVTIGGPQSSSYIAYTDLLMDAEPSRHPQTVTVCHL